MEIRKCTGIGTGIGTGEVNCLIQKEQIHDPPEFVPTGMAREDGSCSPATFIGPQVPYPH